MNIEILSESLKMAVKESFVVGRQVAETITAQTEGMSQQDLEAGILMQKEKFDPDLKADLASAYCSADHIEIDFQRTRAEEAAKRHIFINAARRAVTIGNNKRKRR